MKRIAILFMALIIVSSCQPKNQNCPKSIELINMCSRYDSVRFLIYKLNYVSFLKERNESILQCQLFFDKPILRSDTIIFSFLMLKENKPVYFRNFCNSLYFVNNSLKLIEIDDGAFINVEKDLFEINKNEFIDYVNNNKKMMSNEFKNIWNNIQQKR